jgi:sugar/nucleoside kinase (ribokinase family)
LWDRPKAQEAILEIIAKAKSNGAKFALSLSDTFCIDRHSASVFELIKDSVDILFGNEAEWQTLLALEPGTEHLDLVEQAWVTMGDRGAVVHSRDLDSGSPLTTEIDPVETTVVDTTGAGDQFAAGVLYGLAAGLSLEQAGKLGVAAASEVISHIGPRPERPYSELLG